MQQKFDQAVKAQQSGNLDTAQRKCRSILSKHPQHGATLQLLGVLMQQAGNNSSALHYLQQALTITPENPQLLKNLAEIYRLGHDLENAQQYVEKALAIEPANTDALYIAASINRQLKQPYIAIRQLSRLLEIDPTDYQSRNELANLFCITHQNNLAVNHYLRALEQKSDYVECQMNLADTYLDLNQVSLAIEQYKQIIDQYPQNADAHNRLGMALVRQDNSDQARACYQTALECEPAHLDARVNLGKMDIEFAPYESEKWFRSALDINADYADGYYWLGVLFQGLGKFERATNYLFQAIRIKPEMVYAWYRLSLDHSFTPSSDQLEMLEQQFAQLKETSADQNRRVTLGFTLGRFYDQQSNHEAAFQYYHQSNRIKSDQIKFDPARHQDQIDKTLNIFNREFFAKRNDWGNQSDAPIFIIGMPRSGTTLVEQILSAHPSVHGGGELKTMLNLVASLKTIDDEEKQTHAEQLANLDQNQVMHLAQNCLDDMPALQSGAEHISDKLPGNYFRLGIIHLLFPRARIIHCQRDPMDTCWSCYQQNFETGLLFSYDLENLGQAYLGYQRLMSHWQQIMPTQILNLQYEDLISDPIPTSQKLLHHCGIDWEPGVLNYHEQTRPVNTASLWQARQPLYKTSIGRWKAYREYLKPLQEVIAKQQTQ